jgi:serine phosphatase RsbU (regulator of sigma subunit)
MVPGVPYACESILVPRDRHLYLLSDGTFEVERTDGTMMRFDELLALITAPGNCGPLDLDHLYRYLLATRGSETLEDDLSIVRFTL